MQTTIIGPYPRVGSESADALREERNKYFHGKGNPAVIDALRKQLTQEILHEIDTAIDLPNYGFVDIHDELDWVPELFEGTRFGGMKKIFHTNRHYRETIVTGELREKPYCPELYAEAVRTVDKVKVELPGPYTLACHSTLTENAPYANLEELTKAYARALRTIITAFSLAHFNPARSTHTKIPLLQFNEPSLIAYKRTQPIPKDLPNIYAEMIDGFNDIPTAVWTFYGKYTQENLDSLFSLPVGTIGLDLVWDPSIVDWIKTKQPHTSLGLGIIDSGDRADIYLEDKRKVIDNINQLRGRIDLDKTYIAPNATLRHLPRDYAQAKIKLLGEIKQEVTP